MSKIQHLLFVTMSISQHWVLVSTPILFTKKKVTCRWDQHLSVVTLMPGACLVLHCHIKIFHNTAGTTVGLNSHNTQKHVYFTPWASSCYYICILYFKKSNHTHLWTLHSFWCQQQTSKSFTLWCYHWQKWLHRPINSVAVPATIGVPHNRISSDLVL